MDPQDPRQATTREREKITDWVADNRAEDGRQARREVESAAIAVFDQFTPTTGGVTHFQTFAVVVWENGHAEPWILAETARPFTEAPATP